MESFAASYVGGTQAYLSVPAESKAKILDEGYVVRRRLAIPGHKEMGSATEAMLQYQKDQSIESELIEVHHVPKDWVCQDPNDPRGVHITTPDSKDGLMWLKPEYLRTGHAVTRDAAEYDGKMCMFCNSAEHLDRTFNVGEARFIGTAFMCSPCKNPVCVSKMEDRTARLMKGEVRELFHRADKTVANSLRGATKGKMIRGDFYNKAGAAGGGIYFGHTARECTWKSEAPGFDKVTFKCKVSLGTPKMTDYKYCPDNLTKEMFRQLVTHEDGPFDSVILDRAAKNGVPATFPVPPAPIRGTRLEALDIGEKLHPGYEFVVYSWDQVQVLEEVPEDPVPSDNTFEFVDGVRVL